MPEKNNKPVRTRKKKEETIRVIVHYPTTAEGRKELEERVANAHSRIILQMIQNLSCSTEQKLALLQAVIDTYDERIKNKEKRKL